MTEILKNASGAVPNRRRVYGALLGLIASACCLYLSIDLTGQHRWTIRVGYLMILLFFLYRLVKARPFSIWSRAK